MRAADRLRTPALYAAGVALIAAIALAIYANSLTGPFLLDDQWHIVENGAVSSFASAASYLFGARGIATFTFALNHRWGGLEVRGYHLVNVLIHVINGLLVYALTAKTLRLPLLRPRYERRARLLGFLTALVFITHPLQSMAVSYTTQRMETLAVLFSLLAVLLVTMGITSQARSSRIAWFAGAVAACHLAVTSKEVAATTPLLALLHDRFFSAPSMRAVARRWVLYATLAATTLAPLARSLDVLNPWRADSVVTGSTIASNAPPVKLTGEEEEIARNAKFREDAASAGFATRSVTPWRYLITEVGVIAWYLRLFAVPTGLCFDPGWPFADSIWRANVLLPLALLLAIGAAAVRLFPRHRPVSFAITAFFLALAPSSSILPINDAAFEYRMYFPVYFLSLAVIIGASDALERIRRASGWSPARLEIGALALAAAWIVTLGVATSARNRVYESAISLWSDTVAKAPHHWRAQYVLGTVLLNAGRHEEAVPHLEEAIRLKPDEGASYVNLALAYKALQQWDKAEEAARRGTRADVRSAAAAAYLMLGQLAQGRQRWDDAARNLRLAARFWPQWGSIRERLANVYAAQGRWEDAAGEYEAAMTVEPRLTDALRTPAATARFRNAMILAARGRRDLACADWQKAVDLQPRLVTAYPYVALCYAEREDWARSEDAMQKAVELKPSDLSIRTNLARVQRREKPVVSLPAN